ncbi:TPA: glycosyltransferase family 2 protein [Streptococcus suis]
MKEIKVSIIVPVYNASTTIEKCLLSIVNQSLDNLEVILVNDGSKDNSLEILERFEEKYQTIRMISKENEGAAIARNIGIKMARGEYILFVDSDDYIQPDYAEQFYQRIKSSGADIVIGGLRRVDKDGKVLGEILPKKSEWGRYMITSPCARIFNREFLVNNKLYFIPYTMEDIYYTAVCIEKSAKIDVTSYAGYNNYLNQLGTTHTAHRGIRPEIDLLYIFDNINKQTKPTELLKMFYKKNYIYYLLYSGRTSSPELFKREHRRITHYLLENELFATKSIFARQFRDESFRNQLIIFIFTMLEKCKLIGLFAQIYCKG